MESPSHQAEISDCSPKGLGEQSETMNCSFGGIRQEHVPVVDGDHVSERWRTLAHERDIGQSKLWELKKTFDSDIGQIHQVYLYLHQYHDDINPIVNADNKHEGV